MLTTIIYRSHICDDVPVKALETMVAAADSKNRQSDVTGILLFNGTHFFQLLEGPVENVTAIYEQICRDPRHHNVVELMRDHGPSGVLAMLGWNSLICATSTGKMFFSRCLIRARPAIS